MKKQFNYEGFEKDFVELDENFCGGVRYTFRNENGYGAYVYRTSEDEGTTDDLWTYLPFREGYYYYKPDSSDLSYEHHDYIYCKKRLTEEQVRKEMEIGYILIFTKG